MKSTYSAVVRVPAEHVALMSAIPSDDDKRAGEAPPGKKVFSFNQARAACIALLMNLFIQRTPACILCYLHTVGVRQAQALLVLSFKTVLLAAVSAVMTKIWVLFAARPHPVVSAGSCGGRLGVPSNRTAKPSVERAKRGGRGGIRVRQHRQIPDYR